MLTESQLPDRDFNRLLLHICCAPDAVFIARQFRESDKDIAGYFYNPNIHPRREYNFRLKEMQTLAEKLNLNLLIGEYDSDIWFEKTEGLENEPERGERCKVCIQRRLEKTAQKSKAENFEAFATVLTNSPHKDIEMINSLGEKIAGSYGVKYLKSFFRKSEGFKKSVELSGEYDLYRQDYCGCKYSRID